MSSWADNSTHVSQRIRLRQNLKWPLQRARLLIEQAETLGEPIEDRLLLFSTLFGFWMANYAVFDGAAARDIATQFLTLAEVQRNSGLTVVGHRMAGACRSMRVKS